MRYILTSDGYIDEITFGATIECKDQTCIEYTGTIPNNYSSLEEWVIGEEGKLNAWKIVDGNLVFDNAKYNELQSIYEKQEKDNSCVTHKEIAGVSSNIKDLYISKNSSADKIITLNDGANLTMNKINIKPLENISNEIDIVVTGSNMLPNTITTLTVGNMKFTQNKDKSIKINGKTSSQTEVNLAGTSENTNCLFTFKKNITYKLSGLVDNVKINFYFYDGTDRELVSTSGNGNITFDNDKHVTQITISIIPPTNIQVGDDLSGKTLNLDFPSHPIELMSEKSTTVVNCTNGKITYEKYSATGIYEIVSVTDLNNKEIKQLYSQVSYLVEVNLSNYVLPEDFGTVTSIDTINGQGILDHIQVTKELKLNETIYPMMNIGNEVKPYEPYESNSCKILLGDNTLNASNLYPSNEIYPSEKLYPGTLNYITIANGDVKLVQGNNETYLKTITMPSSYFGNNTIYTHQDTKMLVNYISGVVDQRIIKLEGYTTINDGFSVDLEGNMTCNNATMNKTKIVGGRLDLTDNGGSSDPSIKITKNDNNHTNLISSNLIQMGGGGRLIYMTTNEEFYEDIVTPIASFNGYFKVMNNGNIQNTGDYQCDGDITCNTLTQTSVEDKKKNIELFKDGLTIIKDTDIYKYHFKTQNDDEKKHIGFIIGENRKYSSEITSVDKSNKEIGVDTYAMVSVCFNAIKELSNKVEQLENKIKEMESDK